MNIKKFTQFISEKEHYSFINEGDIVPGVPYNAGSGSGTGLMTVNVTEDDTQIGFIRQSSTGDKPGIRLYLAFPPSKKPYQIKNIDPSVDAYAYVRKDKITPGDNKLEYIAAVTNMADFDAIKSGRYLTHNANSIDLIAEFITSSGIASDPVACTKLAKVIATLASPTYKLKVTDTFIKFANNIIMNVKNNGFVVRMDDDFITVKQSKGMQAFRTELVKSYDALSKPKTADATKK